jgi:hypothetical protein
VRVDGTKKKADLDSKTDAPKGGANPRNNESEGGGGRLSPIKGIERIPNEVTHEGNAKRYLQNGFMVVSYKTEGGIGVRLERHVKMNVHENPKTQDLVSKLYTWSRW